MAVTFAIRPQRLKSGLLNRVPAVVEGLFGPVLLVFAWELIARGVPSLRYTLGAPSGIISQMWLDRELYALNIPTTLREAALGFLIGNCIAIGIAISIVRFPVLENGLMRVAVVIHAMPLLAVAPIITVVLVGESSKVALAALSVFFATLIATLIGLRSADGAALDLIHTLGGGSWTALRKIRLKAGVPWMLAGLRIATPAAILGAILGEFLGNDSGLGVAMVNAMATLNTNRVWGLAVMASLLSGGGFAAMALVSRVLVPWAPTLSIGPSAASKARAARNGLTALARRLALSLLSIAVVVAGWDLLLRVFNLNTFFAKSPAAVFSALVLASNAPTNRTAIEGALLTTLVDAGLGFLVGTLLAIAIATLFVAYRPVEKMFMPLAIALRSVPVIAVTPLLVVIFGRGLSVTLAISALFTFFTTLVNVMEGLRSTPPNVIDLMRALNSSRWTVILKVRWFSALPSLFASARVSVLGSVLGTIVAEWLATGQGLGRLMILSRAQYEFDLLWSSAVVLTITSAGVYALIGFIEAPVLRRFAPGQSS